MYTYSFEKLDVWIEAKVLSKNIYMNALRNYQINK